MRINSYFALLVMPIFSAALAQSPGPPSQADSEQAPKVLGSYSLVVTTLEPSAATHALNPPLTIVLDAATALEPKENVGAKMIPAQYAIEKFSNPRFDCIPADTAPNKRDACEAIDRAELTIRDPSTIAWRVTNHGGAAQLELNIEVRDLAPVSHSELQSQWHAQDVIFIPVPKSTPSLRVVSAVLVGDWNGTAVVFEPGKALLESAKKALEDLNIHQDLGDKTLYSYEVKDPKPK